MSQKLNAQAERSLNGPYGGQPYGSQPYGGQAYGGRPYGGADPRGGSPYGGQPYLQDPYGGRAPGHSIDIDKLIAAGRRQLLVIGLSVGLCIAAGVGFLAVAEKKYTSSAQVLIDSKLLDVVNESSGTAARASDEAGVLSLIENAMSRQVVDKVTIVLASDENFAKISEGSFLKETLAAYRAKTLTVDGMDPAEVAGDVLGGDFSATRLGRSAALEFTFTATDPADAALVANTFAQVFIDNQLDTRFDARQRAGDWLKARLEELRTEAQTAQAAVETFRAENNLAQTDGKLLSDQQLATLSDQYVQAQAATATAEARYNQIKALVDSQNVGAVVEDALANTVISDLRKQYLDAARRATDLEARLGPRHQQVIRLEDEKREYQRLIFTELQRISESYLSDYEVASQRQANLEERFRTMLGDNVDISATMVQLRELEQRAEVYQNLYQEFLKRYEEASRDQSFPVSEIRVMSAARAPLGPSFPKPPLVLALSTILGLGIGVGLGALREYRDRTIRSGDHVRQYLGLDFLGEVPLVALRNQESAEPVEREPMEGDPIVNISSPILRYAAMHPMSAFAEALRAVRHVANRQRYGRTGAKVIGFGSLVPGEGKTTMALNFATLVASTGQRVLLIDTDFRNPATSRSIAPRCELGLAEAIHSNLDAHEVIYRDEGTGLNVLPINVRNPQVHSSELLSTPFLENSLAKLTDEYDYIVLDLPPIGPIVDVRIVVPLLDIMALVVEWGKLPIAVIQAAVQSEPEIFDRCAGVILNKVDSKKNRLYAADSTRTYLSSQYQKYYKEP
ncbi:AAA family ATPase [Mongoliimonas terrestris]|uniref:AAA family ATPase n=1 Tax=Mongoliimonas terrestris TaxID=1709001 RepID=UPI0009495304|nr:AAA family ATPase [Mongoliimonas terrestris]